MTPTSVLPAPRYVEVTGERGLLRGFWQPARPLRAEQTVAPVVVMLHGLSGSITSNGYLFVGQTRKLAEAGIASLRVDFFGCGNSDGEHADVTVWTELSDAQRIFEYAAQQPDTDPARMGLLGYSFGGRIAALLTEIEPRIQALVAWSPAIDPRTGAAFAAAPEPVIFGGVAISKAFIRSVDETNPVEAISRFTRPTLVIHGDADETVNMGSGALFAEKTGGQLILVSGGNHSYEQPDGREMLYTNTTRHFVEYLRT